MNWSKLQAVLLGLIRVWWRPLAEINLVISTFVNGVALPIWNEAPVTLTELSALVVAWAPLFAIRSYDKSKGTTSEDAAP